MSTQLLLRRALPKRAAVAATSLLAVGGALGLSAASASAATLTPTPVASAPVTETASVTTTGKNQPADVTIGLTTPSPATYVAPSALSLTLPGLFSLNTADAADFPAPPATVGTVPVGTVTAVSPLTGASPITGNVFLTGGLTNPGLEISFENGAITIPGTLGGLGFPLTINFPSLAVPALGGDLPWSSLSFNFQGSSSPALANCTGSGAITTAITDNTAFAGAVTSLTSGPITVAGCPIPPVVGGSFTGLAAGKPKLSFSVAAGTGGKAFSSFSVKLPSGLSVIKSKKLAKELSLTGGKVKSASASGGTLNVTLKAPSSKVGLKLTAMDIAPSQRFIKAFAKHQVKSLKFTITEGGLSSILTIKKFS